MDLDLTTAHPHVSERVGPLEISSVSAPTVAPLPEPVVKVFAERGHRLHHQAWHSVRQAWPILDAAKQARIEELGWKPPRASADYLRGKNSRPATGNGSGEDFLFMHRQMIALFRAEMKKAGADANIAWVVPPAPGEPEDAPPMWDLPIPVLAKRIGALKSDEYYWSRLRWWDREFKDPSRLRTLTLAELGSLIEYSIHNDMHMRWSATPIDPETGKPTAMGRESWDLSKKWDSPKYDWLGEFYSSHVNPFFWRLHGWVDDRIDDWFRAHEDAHPGQVRRTTVGGVQWFAPGAWVVAGDPWAGPDHGGHGHGANAPDEHAGHDHGGHGSHGDHGDHGAMNPIRAMEEVIAILFPKPAETLRAGVALDGVTTPRQLDRSIFGAWFGVGL